MAGRTEPQRNRDSASPLFGLAPGGVCQASRVTSAAGALLPHPFTLTCAVPSKLGTAIGGLLSVALSLTSRPVGVTDHPALRCPDFPLAIDLTSDRPIGSETSGNLDQLAGHGKGPTRREREGNRRFHRAAFCAADMVGGDLRSAVSAGSETRAEQWGRPVPSGGSETRAEQGGRPVPSGGSEVRAEQRGEPLCWPATGKGRRRRSADPDHWIAEVVPGTCLDYSTGTKR